MSTNRINELEKLIVEAKKAYYLGSPIMSDKNFDALEDELRNLDPNNPILQIVGSESSKGEIYHDPPMLSAAKIADIDDAIKWASNYEVVWGFKVDGLSVKLVYLNGKLIQASTRGNGLYGENVLDKAVNFVNIPLTIPTNKFVEIRGEAYIPLSIFKKLGEGISSRNLATGTLNALDPLLTKKRKIHFMAWDLIGRKPLNVDKKVALLKKLGFDVADQGIVTGDDIRDVYVDVTAKRSNYDFEMDGIVYKINDAKIQAKMGSTSHHPRWLAAVKFPDQVGITKIDDIVWQVGRSGKLTPVALIKPIFLSDATLSRATLYNKRFVYNNDIAVGDDVNVIRSGAVIPKVLSVAKKGSGCVNIPTYCPECQSQLKDDGVNIWCCNANCGEARFLRLQNYANVLEIEHLGPKTLRKLWDKGLTREPSDLYKVSQIEYRNLIGLNGVKIYKQLNAKKKIPLHYFLTALGIPGLSYETAKLITRKMKTFNTVLNSKKEDFIAIKGIGPTTADNIVTNLTDTNLYKPLLDVGIIVKDYIPKKKPKAVASPITGMKIYITGSVPGYKDKKSLQSLVESNGGIWKGMSKSLDLLVLGEKAGWKKIEDARNWGLKTMNYKDFLKWLGL